jgi:branched-chain amino acid transport system permease protein
MNSRWRWAALGTLAMLLVLVPHLVSSYYVGLATKMLVFALFAMSLDLLLGHAGMASLGHAAYFGMSAYVVGLLAVKAGWGFWLALPAGLLAACALAASFGLVALRARGSYFLMTTLALAQVLWAVAFGWRSMTGGDDGLPNIARPDLGLGWSLAGSGSYYYFTLVIVAAAAAALAHIVRSPFGQALRGIRESETRMLALGYDAWRYKYAAFVLAGTFAGLAGALYAYQNSFVGPESLHVLRSAEVLLMVILGGSGTLAGPAIGAALIVFMQHEISAHTQRWLIILGWIYVLVTMFAPQGLMGLVRRSRP